MPADGAPAESPGAQAGRVRLAWWIWLGALAAGAVVLFLCFLRLSATIPVNSDGSDQALQAWDMLHGNWLLRGWTVGDVSYYTTEIPEYIAVEKIIGLGPNVIHVASAATYTLLVLLAGLLAKGRANGREGIVRALIASGILLAPELDHGIHLLISQPDHLGTQVPLLVIFIVLDRAWYRYGGTKPKSIPPDPPPPDPTGPPAPPRSPRASSQRADRLVLPGCDRGDARLGHHLRPSRRIRCGGSACRRLRRPRPVGHRPRRQAAGLPVARVFPDGGGHRLVRRGRTRGQRDQARGRVHIPPAAVGAGRRTHPPAPRRADH